MKNMKRTVYHVIVLILLLHYEVIGQDSPNQMNTRNYELESVLPADSLSDSPLFEPFSKLGYSESIKFYEEMFDSIETEATTDSVKNTFWGKVETGSGYLTKSTDNFTAGTAPVFFILLAVWFLLRFVKVFILQPSLPEPGTEEADDE